MTHFKETKLSRLLSWAPLRLVTTRTGQQAGIVSAGNAANKALTFLTQSVLGRAMDKPTFALFNVTAMALEIFTELADLGLNFNLVRNYSCRAEKNRNAALSVVQLILRVKVVWVLFLTVVLYLLMPYATLLLRSPDLLGPFRFATIGLAGPVMIYFALAHLQAVRWFGRYVIINVLERASILGLILVLALTGALTLDSALSVWILFPLLTAVLALVLTPHDYLRVRRIEPGVMGDVVRFGKWAWLASLLILAVWRLDVFMLKALTTAEKLADYVFAVRLVALFQVVTQGLHTALLPRVGGFATVAECRSYLKTVAKVAPLAAVGTGLICLFAWPLMVIPFGSKAASAVAIFRILAIGETMVMISAPVVALLYRFNRVDLICLAYAIMLATSATLNALLIPSHGSMGAAIAYLVARVSVLISAVILVLYTLRRPVLSNEEMD